MTMSRLIHDAAARHPTAPAILTGDAALDYAQLAERVDAAAALLHTRGVKSGEIVALALARAPLWQWVFLLGALRLGAVPAALGRRPQAQLRAIPGEAPHVVAPEGSALARLPGVRGIEVSTAMLRKIVDTRKVLGLPEAAATDASAGLIEFGGLDEPRALRLDGATLLARCSDMAAVCALEPAARLLGALGADAAPGIEAALAAWSVGATLVLEGEAAAPIAPLQVARAYRLLTTPQALAAWLPDDSAPDLREQGCQVSVLGAPPPAAVLERCRRVFGSAPQVMLWAPESGVFSVGTGEDLVAHPGCVGRPRAGVTVEVVGRDGNALPQGQTGLIRVHSPSACAGYLDGGESLSGFGLRQGGYDSGLVGLLAADGRLCVEGAAVRPRPPKPADGAGTGWQRQWSRAELEATVAALPGVTGVCVLSQTLPDRGAVPVIVYTGDSDEAPGPMGQRLRAVLGADTRFHLIRVPALPMGADGAVDRDRLATSLQAAIRQTLPQAVQAAQAARQEP